ncbi:hypothetical protein [Xenorhabdus szentirmaii]|uniref:Uncharacterized protein n=1 Tax=Xenorhabdus szentirmaii DSM 16338 TaxID=1427518 RepID=W1J4X1_9GAMM|nr:hypothetical protein [Xenorhabdus szentirmaii]CDL85784.1 hypothetical protein XSR1_940003 [Xenorhabdus szentirmaii DSM 16338]
MKFRIYSNFYTGSVRLTTEMFGVLYPTYAESVYLAGSYDSSLSYLDYPFILNILPGGVIRKEVGDKGFRVDIRKYNSPHIGDNIIFLIEDEDNKVIQFKPAYSVDYVDGVPNVGGYNYQLSYENVPFNKRMSFYYIVINFSGNYSFSKKLSVIFVDDTGDGR